jgi:hypothetical protein
MKAWRNELTGRWHLEGVEEITFQNICQWLKDGTAFKFARYGDGELNCMNGKTGRNCDLHEYFPDLGVRLIESLKPDNGVMVGIQPLSISHMPDVVNHYFKDYTKLYDADVLHSASIDGKMNHFFDSLSGRYIILVGPAHLAGLFDCVHIVIPPVNCWLSYEKIKEQLTFHLDADDAVVLLCCSMMAEVFLDDFSYSTHTFIDCGSVLDPFVGVKSRKYHHKL